MYMPRIILTRVIPGLFALFLLTGLIWVLVSRGCSSNSGPPPYADDKDGLRHLAEARGLVIGTEVWWDPLTSDTTYQSILDNEFSMVIPGDFFRWDRIHSTPQDFDFSQIDQLAIVAGKNEQDLWLGHLVWHPKEWLPMWFVLRIAEREAGRPFSRPLSDSDKTEVRRVLENYNPTPQDRDEARRIFKRFITEAVSRYRGRATAWTVVNEPIIDSPPLVGDPLRQSFWRVMLGPDYIEIAFRVARAADPDVLLLLNEYGAENLGAKSQRLYELVVDLRKRGVPIDGVGMQMHVQIDGEPAVDAIRQNIRRLSNLGVEVWVTEMDVRLQLPATQRDLQLQADRYSEILRLCLNEPGCTRFVMWGFTDRYSWIPAKFPGFGNALMLDENYRPKPAYQAIRDVLLHP